MSVFKCSSLSFATVVAAIFAMLPAITLAQSTDYRFESGSTFTFSAGFFPTQVFDISGTFTLNENESENFIDASITDVNLSFSPSTPDPRLDLTSVEGFTSFLESSIFTEVPSVESQTVYQGFSEQLPYQNIISNDPYSLVVDNGSANRLLTISGAGDGGAAVDGPSFRFSATAVAVPEPTGLPVWLMLTLTFITRRQRGDSSSLT